MSKPKLSCVSNNLVWNSPFSMYVHVFILKVLRGRWDISWFKNPQGVVPLPNQPNLFLILRVTYVFVTQKSNHPYLHILYHFYWWPNIYLIVEPPSHRVTSGGSKFFNRKGGVGVEMGGLPLFITLQFNHIYSVCVKSKEVKFPLLLFFIQSFELAMQDFHRSLYSTKTFYHWYISDPFW